MPEQLLIATEADQAPPPRELSPAALRWFELALVLCIAFGGSLFTAIHILIGGQVGQPYSQNSSWLFGLFHDLTALFLLGYILARRKLGFRSLGLRWSAWDIVIGVGLAIGSYLAYSVGYPIVRLLHNALFGAAHTQNAAHLIFGRMGISALPVILLNPFFEELIVRAYLMTEIKALTGSATLAVALSVALQTSYHLYYGWVGALSLGFQFLVFAIYYAKMSRATPIIVAHGIFDLIAFSRFL